jgi:hypothetical protein
MLYNCLLVSAINTFPISDNWQDCCPLAFHMVAKQEGNPKTYQKLKHAIVLVCTLASNREYGKKVATTNGSVSMLSRYCSVHFYQKFLMYL